jgi:hypothetical protein
MAFDGFEHPATISNPPHAKKRKLKIPRQSSKGISKQSSSEAPREQHAQSSPSPSAKALQAREKTEKRRKKLWDLLTEGFAHLPDRQQRCNRVRIAPSVQVQRWKSKIGDRCSYSGLMQCGNANICPVCAAKIRTARARELSQLARHHWNQEGNSSLRFMTLTIRHGKKSELKPMLKALNGAWRKCWRRLTTKRKHLGGRRYIDVYGLKGYSKSLEVTWSERNGFHPHLHFLLFFERDTKNALIDSLKTRVFDLWKKYVVDDLGEEYAPTAKNGVDLRGVKGEQSPEDLADYMVKIAFELSDPVTKTQTAKKKTSPMFNVLQMAINGSKIAAGVWAEYCEAIKGTRVYELTRTDGFFDDYKLALGMKEKTDLEIVEETEGGELVLTIEKETWHRVCKRGKRLELLQQAEKGGSSGALDWLIKTGLWGGTLERISCQILEPLPDWG